MSPRSWFERLLRRLLAPHLHDAILGDLEEIFREEAQRSRFRAHLNYHRRALGALAHLARWPRRAHPRSNGDAVMVTILRDLARGSRLFLSQPAFASAAVVTLALAIGANTLIFTIANVLVLKPLPFKESERLGWILTTMSGQPTDRAGMSLPDYAAFRDEATSFTSLAARRWQPMTLRSGGAAEKILAHRLVGDLHGVWGLRAERGRALMATDERPGAPPVAVLSHRFWSNRFGGADAIVGLELLLDGQPHRVVGVLGAEIELGTLSEIDVWIPQSGDPRTASRAERQWQSVGRLRDEATHDEAHAQVQAIASRLARQHPETNRGWMVRVGTTRSALGGTNTWVVLSLLSALVGLLLLLACANVMNLLIARLIGRRQELAVRTALGASRTQVVRQILGESALLGIVGGALGVAIAAAGLQGVHAIAAEPFFQQLAFDYRVLLFAAALSLFAPLIFSVLPTLRVLREDVRDTLNEGSTRSVGSATAARSRSALVVLQVSLAVTLLIVATLVVRSMQAIVSADPGYDTSRLLVTQIEVPTWKVADESAALRMRERLVARLSEMPGAQAAALATHIPAFHTVPHVSFDVDGRVAADAQDRPAAALVVVTAAYFNTLQVPILAGRGFTEADAASPRAVAVVSAEAARRYWPGGGAVGATLGLADPVGGPLVVSVVGVARNTANAVTPDGPAPTVFVLDQHRPTRQMHAIVRAETPASFATLVRAAVAEVDPDLVAFQLRTLVAAFAEENSSNHLLTGLFLAFALTAVLLATAGLYGVLSYAVSQRSGEIAVRLALGASGGVIARQVIGQSARLVAVGTSIGVVSAYAIARAVGSILFGVTATDPATYAGSIGLTLVATLAATWIPMRRAATIDPIGSLRRG